MRTSKRQTIARTFAFRTADAVDTFLSRPRSAKDRASWTYLFGIVERLLAAYAAGKRWVTIKQLEREVASLEWWSRKGTRRAET